MICPFCGKKNSEPVSQCRHCGVSFQHNSLIPDILPPRKKRISPWIIVCSSLGIFHAIVLIIIWIQK